MTAREILSEHVQDCVHLGTCIYDKNCHEHHDLIDSVLSNRVLIQAFIDEFAEIKFKHGCVVCGEDLSPKIKVKQ